MYRFTQKKKEKKSFSDTWYGTAIIFIAIMFIVGQCSDASGPQYPLDPSNADAEYQADMSEQDNRNYDPGEGYVVEPLFDPVDPGAPTQPLAASKVISVWMEKRFIISPVKSSTTPPK